MLSDLKIKVYQENITERINNNSIKYLKKYFKREKVRILSKIDKAFIFFSM